MRRSSRLTDYNKALSKTQMVLHLCCCDCSLYLLQAGTPQASKAIGVYSLRLKHRSVLWQGTILPQNQLCIQKLMMALG